VVICVHVQFRGRSLQSRLASLLAAEEHECHHNQRLKTLLVMLRKPEQNRKWKPNWCTSRVQLGRGGEHLYSQAILLWKLVHLGWLVFCPDTCMTGTGRPTKIKLGISHRIFFICGGDMSHVSVFHVSVEYTISRTRYIRNSDERHGYDSWRDEVKDSFAVLHICRVDHGHKWRSPDAEPAPKNHRR
jgi:hypothetical protein